MEQSRAISLDVEAWPRMVEHFRGQWSPEAIITDLRWWSVVGNRPGRPGLAKRWGVSDRTARKYMTDHHPTGDSIHPTLRWEPRCHFPLDVHPARLSHGELCEIGWRWLMSLKCDAVIEPPSCVRLTPDVIGWMDDGPCVLIEAKRTRSDFLNDVWKNPSPAPGHYRWYLTTEEVADAHDSTPGWGMLHVTRSGVVVVKSAPLRTLGKTSRLGGELIMASVDDRLAAGWRIDDRGRMVRP